jgi:hypothetical protein
VIQYGKEEEEEEADEASLLTYRSIIKLFLDRSKYLLLKGTING